MWSGSLVEVFDGFCSLSRFSGRPRPNVTWYLDNMVIDESYETRPDGTTVNHLSYPNIGRQHLDARLMCVASNTNLTPPNNKVVVLDVNRKCFTYPCGSFLNGEIFNFASFWDYYRFVK